MDVTYKSHKIKQELTDPYGKLLKSNPQRSKLMFRRIEELTSADTLHDLRFTGGSCHELEGDMKGQLAVKLDGGWRLIFEPADDPLPRLAGGGLDWKSVRSVRILEAKDYHNG